MKRVIAISLLASIGVTIGMWAAAWIASGPRNELCLDHVGEPRVVLPNTRRDLGTVSADTPLETYFAIHNQGTRRLIIRREQGACCGQAEEDGMVIVMPGHSSLLPVVVDATDQVGRFEKTLTYTTNDPSFPRFELKISARFSNSQSRGGAPHLTSKQ